MTNDIARPELDVPRRIYAAGLRAVYGRRGLPWEVHGNPVRIDPGVRHLVPRAGEPALVEFLQRTISPGATVLDVGSFLGIYAMLEARWAGRSGRVVALEPTAASARIARRHLAFNALADRVDLLEAAAGELAGDATFHEYPLPYVNGLMPAVDTAASPTTRRVRVVTIDDICRDLNLRPSLIRMDVQGAEMHALRGARETIRACGRALTIVVEMHPQCWPAFGVDEAGVRATLDALALEARPIVPGGPVFGRDAHVVLRANSPAAVSA